MTRPGFGRPVALSFLAFLGVLGTSAVTASAQAPGSVTFGIAPGPRPPADDPRAAYAVVDHIEAGERLERRLRFDNDTDEELTVDFTDEPARLDDGTFTFVDAGLTNDLARWTSVTPARATVASGSHVDVRVLVRVPRAVRPEEHYGMVWATIGPTAGGDGTTRTRVGVRMYVHVGDGDPAARFTVTRVRPRRTAAGDPVVDVRLANTGARAVDVAGSVAPDRPGSEATAFAVAAAPRQTATTSVALRPALSGRVSLVVRSSANGIEHVQRVEVAFPRRPGAAGRAVSVAPPDDGDGGSEPVAVVAATALLAAAAALLVVHGRRS